MFTAAISGRVGSVTQKDFGDGRLKTQISIAVKAGRGDAQKTAWFNCDAGIGKQADFWRSAVAKGDLVSATVRVYGFYNATGTGDINFNCAIVELTPPPKAREANGGYGDDLGDMPF